MSDESRDQQEDLPQNKRATDDIPDHVKAEAKKVASITVGFLRGYAEISDKAKSGAKVTGGDFEMIDRAYNANFGVLEGFMETVGAMPELEDAATGHIQESVREGMRGSGRLDYMALTGAFHDQYVTNSHREHLPDIGETGDARQLVKKLLGENPGIAVADNHTRTEPLEFLTRNMAVLKDEGVDTIYIETSVDRYEWMMTASDEELRRSAGPDASKEVAEEQMANAEFYGVSAAQMAAVHKAEMEMILAGREHGMRIINIDRVGPARDIEIRLSMEHRIASTNFTWTDNILEDRESSNDKDSKYVVFGGTRHFVGIRTPTYGVLEGNGLVDEALGIPSIGFEHRPQDEMGRYRKGTNPHGPDYYLQANVGYENVEQRLLHENQDHLGKLALSAELAEDDLGDLTSPTLPKDGEIRRIDR